MFDGSTSFLIFARTLIFFVTCVVILRQAMTWAVIWAEFWKLVAHQSRSLFAKFALFILNKGSCNNSYIVDFYWDLT